MTQNQKPNTNTNTQNQKPAAPQQTKPAGSGSTPNTGKKGGCC